MTQLESLKKSVFFANSDNFEEFAIKLFRFQANNNNNYRNYICQLGIKPKQVNELDEIPFFPIELFKRMEVKTGRWVPEAVFESSGTTGTQRSKHFIEDVKFYHSVCTAGFSHFYGDVQDYLFLTLLPSYLEQENSSLVSMMEHLISLSRYNESGFYLDNINELVDQLKNHQNQSRILLLGVTFALLELADTKQIDLSGVTLMETGGMKGRREEMIREEVHQILKRNLNVSEIHSEYGMTELLSQAYSSRDGQFHCPPWMKIIIRDIYDPRKFVGKTISGGINVIDLANVHSCAFIETQDIGRVFDNGSFEVLGRIDNSDVRGCSLMVI